MSGRREEKEKEMGRLGLWLRVGSGTIETDVGRGTVDARLSKEVGCGDWRKGKTASLEGGNLKVRYGVEGRASKDSTRRQAEKRKETNQLLDYPETSSSPNR